MINCESYFLASDIDSALKALGEAQEPARILAGGTDLLLDLQQGRHPPLHTLVDVTTIPELNALELREGGLFIGAAVTHNVITNSELVQSHAQALAEACGLIGGPQVRNVATLGGNVAHALPAADGTIALMALDAQAEIASLEGRRIIPLEELFIGPGQSTLDVKNEILVGFQLASAQAGQASTFRRIMRPQGVAIAILNCAVWLQRKDDVIGEVRIAIGPSGPTPRRMRQAEEVLTGKSPTGQILVEAHQAILLEASFRTSRHRANKEYREHMAGELLQEALMASWIRAGGRDE